MGNSGSSSFPWSTLQDVFSWGKTFSAGDQIFLRTGHHGSPSITGHHADYVTILPEAGQEPTIRRITVSSGSYWRLQGLTISPETAPSYQQLVPILKINSSASRIMVEGCYLYSVEDASSWSASDWVSKSCWGIDIDGHNNIVARNHILNIDHGIFANGTNNLMDSNVIENFSGDGMRGQGDYNTFQYNTVKNCYDVDDNHDDGFQSYTTAGNPVINGIVLRGNTIISYTDPAQAFRGNPQAIGCFDGYYDDWIVENNVIITDHWHGISFGGARNCKIINNTVVSRTTSPSVGPPRIWLTTFGAPGPSSGNTVRNNISSSYVLDGGFGVQDHNITMPTSLYNTYFTDYPNFDVSLAGGFGVDAGSATDAPTIDRERTPRPLDGNNSGSTEWDCGAYEYAHADVDEDLDGMSDQDEVIAGTSPLDGEDYLSVSNSLDASANMVVTWDSVIDRYYTVSTTTNLTSAWTNVPESTYIDLPGTGSAISYTNLQDDIHRCFRIEVEK